MRRALSLALVLTTMEIIAAPQTVPSAYRVVAAEYGVPQKILFAIALTESGTDRGTGRPLPWPWALNVRGQSQWYASKAEALADLEQVIGAGDGPAAGRPGATR